MLTLSDYGKYIITLHLFLRFLTRNSNTQVFILFHRLVCLHLWLFIRIFSIIFTIYLEPSSVQFDIVIIFSLSITVGPRKPKIPKVALEFVNDDALEWISNYLEPVNLREILQIIKHNIRLTNTQFHLKKYCYVNLCNNSCIIYNKSTAILNT